MERLPLELASIIISLLGVDSRRNFAWAFPSLKDEVHRIDKNTLQITKNGDETIERWFLQGKTEKKITHRWGFASRIIYYNRDGKLHKDEGTGPSVIDYERVNKRLLKVYWYKNDVKHRDEKFGPAEIVWRLSGVLESKTWYRNGVIHRGNNEPAIQKYSYEGEKLYKQYWYENGKKIKTERNKQNPDGKIYKIITTVYPK